MDAALAPALQSFEVQAVEPPRIPAGQAIAQNHDLVWATAIHWVNAHRKFIRKITGKLRPYFPGTIQDIHSLSLLIAFESLLMSVGKGRIDQFVPIFSRRYRHALLEQCQGVPIDDHVDVEGLADPYLSPYFPAPWPQFLPEELKATALAMMSPTQAAVWEHYLHHWDPELGRHGNAKAIGLPPATYYRQLERGIKSVRIQKCQP